MNMNLLQSTDHAVEPPALRTANFPPVLMSYRAAKFWAEKNSEFLVSIFTCWLLLFPGWGFSMGTKYHFHSWRVFVLVCALPCIASLVALKFMPESPRFLLEVRWFISDICRGWQVPNVLLSVFLCPIKHKEQKLRGKATPMCLPQIHRLLEPQRLQTVGSVTGD